MIDAICFFKIYAELVEEIDAVVNEKFYPIIRNMYRDDPRELIRSDRVF